MQRTAILIGFTVCVLSGTVSADDLPDSPRVTPLVKVIHRAEPAVVSLFVFPGQNQLVSGSGTIIHPDGFVLTNHHVLPADNGVALIGSDLPENQQPIQFSVVGRNPERDLAIVKLHAIGPFPTVPLGRSNDLLNGETVIVAGNPGGRGLVFTSGIISARMVLAGTPNAFVMTNYKNSRRPKFIQFDAASNGGNSGGPLINLEGDLIGIVSAKVFQEQNIGFAIPIDDVYQLIEGICEPELLTKKTLGIKLEVDGSKTIVDSVASESAATAAGLQPGDEIVSVNGQDLRHRVDWILSLRTLLPRGQKLTLGVRRGEKQLEVQLRPTELKPQAAADVNETELKPGLRYRFYHGEYSLVPNFAELKPQIEGILTTADLTGAKRDREEYFAVNASGFLNVPEDDLYRLVILSDDGSQLFLHDELIIDNDGNHAPQGVGKLVYLKKGFHPIRFGYFQGNGGYEFQLFAERVGHGQRLAAGEMILHRPESGEEK